MSYLSNATLNAVQYVGDGTNRSGDIGAQINAAYAALPATGGKIIINPKRGGGAYNFSTPVVMTTLGKYPILEAAAPGGVDSSEGCCLNFTPTSAVSAFTLDYATTLLGPPSPANGWRNITLVNNGCVTGGGCGSSATGITIGVTNGGDFDATYDRVMIQGFGLGYLNMNTVAVTQQWNNPCFIDNTICLTIGQATQKFIGGQFAGNGRVFLNPAGTAQSELYFIGTTFFDNFHDPVFDYTVSSTHAFLNLTNCHLENNPSITAHYVQGALDFTMIGGFMEDSNSTSTGDWMIKTDDFTLVTLIGTEIVSNRAYTCIINMDGEVRATAIVTIGSPGNLPTIAAGTFAGEITQIPMVPYGNTPIKWLVRPIVSFMDNPQFGAFNGTGSGSALLGSNCPAVTATAPYTWVRVLTEDGSTGYMPVWK